MPERKVIAASVTTDPNRVIEGGPVFWARSDEEMEHMAMLLSRILDGIAHDVGEGLYVIVQH